MRCGAKARLLQRATTRTLYGAASMALSEAERLRRERAMGVLLEKHRPPSHLRSEVDIAIRLDDKSVEVVEIRPRWDQPKERLERPVAKATYVKSQDLWKVFWVKRDLKWHRYEPAPEVKSLEEFAQLVRDDKHACFFG